MNTSQVVISSPAGVGVAVNSEPASIAHPLTKKPYSAENKAGASVQLRSSLGTAPTPRFHLPSTNKILRGAADFLRPVSTAETTNSTTAANQNNRVKPTSNYAINRNRVLPSINADKAEVSSDGVTQIVVQNAATNVARIDERPRERTDEQSNHSLPSSSESALKSDTVMITTYQPNQPELPVNPTVQPTKLQVTTETSGAEKQTGNTDTISAAPIHQVKRLTVADIQKKFEVPSERTGGTSVNIQKEQKEQKSNRPVFRVPSLRRPKSKDRESKSSSRGPSEERTPKKSEEHIHETVVYTKTKQDLPLNGNRHFLLRNRQQSVERDEEMTEKQKREATVVRPVENVQQVVATTISVPAPQKVMRIPSSGIKMEEKSQPVVQKPVRPAPDVAVARLANQRPQTKNFSPTNSIIRPHLRPVPPRKPISGLLNQTVAQLTQKTTAGNQGGFEHSENVEFRNEPSVDTRDDVTDRSYAGQMSFDDDYGSISAMSFAETYQDSHAPSRQDATLTRGSRIQPAAATVQTEKSNREPQNIEEGERSVHASNIRINPDYDWPKQAPLRPVTAAPQPQSFASSEDTDSSRTRVVYTSDSGVDLEARQRQQSMVTNVPVDQSPGQIRYMERKLALRRLEEDLQRNDRAQSSTAHSFLDGDSVAGDVDSYNDIPPPIDELPRSNKIHSKSGLTPSHNRVNDRPLNRSPDAVIGVPEPLPEYDYPNRIMGRTIEETQEVRETMRLRNDSSSSNSPPGRRRSPIQRPPRQLARRYDMTPEQFETARSLVHHRLPPNYDPRMQPPQSAHLSRANSDVWGRPRPPSQSPARGTAHLPPASPNMNRAPHYSDGEGQMQYREPKKKMSIVRRFSELVRKGKGNKNEAREGGLRSSPSASSFENQQDRYGTAGQNWRRPSPVRPLPDQRPTYRPVAAISPAPVNLAARYDSHQDLPVVRDRYRHSANFSDSPSGTATSFSYREPPNALYAQPNKLSKQQVQMRHKSLSEFDLHRAPDFDAPPSYRYAAPIKASKSIESLSEEVWKEKDRGSTIRLGLFERDPRSSTIKLLPSREQSTERTFKTKLIPLNKSAAEGLPSSNVVSNTTYGMYNKNALQYGSTPVLPNTLPVVHNPYSLRGAPSKPPRRIEQDTYVDQPYQSAPLRRMPSNTAVEHRRWNSQAAEQSLNSNRRYGSTSVIQRLPRETSSSSETESSPAMHNRFSRVKQQGRESEFVPSSYTGRRYQSIAADIDKTYPTVENAGFSGRNERLREPQERRFQRASQVDTNRYSRPAYGAPVQERAKIFAGRR